MKIFKHNHKFSMDEDAYETALHNIMMGNFTPEINLRCICGLLHTQKVKLLFKSVD